MNHKTIKREWQIALFGFNKLVNKMSINEEMKCPVCWEYMMGAIRMCNQGHNVCEECRNGIQNNKCPQCREPFLPNVRNYALENIIAKYRSSDNSIAVGNNTETKLANDEANKDDDYALNLAIECSTYESQNLPLEESDALADESFFSRDHPYQNSELSDSYGDNNIWYDLGFDPPETSTRNSANLLDDELFDHNGVLEWYNLPQTPTSRLTPSSDLLDDELQLAIGLSESEKLIEELNQEDDILDGILQLSLIEK